MASLTVRNIPDEAKRRFRQVAAAHGRSMEEHLRQMVIAAASGEDGVTSGVREASQPFQQQRHEPKPEESWVYELIRIADGAGEGVFDPEPQPLREFDL